MVCVALSMFTPAWAATKTTLYAFGRRHGAHPSGALVFDSAGNLYGTTRQGGLICDNLSFGCGTVYQLAPQPDGTWRFQVLHEFAGGTDGIGPYAGMIFDSAGNLYGTTAGGGLIQEGGTGDGVVFELSPGNGWSETILHIFGAQSGDGLFPDAPLIFDKSGNLYGTTYNALNPCGDGSVFELSPNPAGGWIETQLFCFSTYSGGTYPSSGLIFDKAGNLYSTTFLGGAYEGGVIFELTPSGGSWIENILYNFATADAGATALISDKSGNLYGATFSSVYELTPSPGGGWTYTTVYLEPSGPHGIFSNSLIMDHSGNLYGTAYGGNSSNCRGGGCGAVFKLTHGTSGWHQTVLYNFQGGADGAGPYGDLVLDQQGNLYGTTLGGGQNCEGGCGTVFKIIP